MNSFTSLYLFYCAKVGSQASIYFIWLDDSSSETIAFLAGAVAVFATFPLFHVIVHVFLAKPLSNSTFIAYLCFCFLFAILWYEPTRDGEQRTLPFPLVTTIDLLALLIFLLRRQIGYWRINLRKDVEKGQLTTGSTDDVPVNLGGHGIEQAQHCEYGDRPDTPQNHTGQVLEELENSGSDPRRNTGCLGDEDVIGLNDQGTVNQVGGPVIESEGFDQRLNDDETSTDVTIRGPSYVGWSVEMVQPIEADEADLDSNQRSRQTRRSFDVQLDDNSDSDTFSLEDVYPSCPAGTPVTIYSHIHPSYRPSFDFASQMVSPEGIPVPKQLRETAELEYNKI